MTTILAKDLKEGMTVINPLSRERHKLIDVRVGNVRVYVAYRNSIGALLQDRLSRYAELELVSDETEVPGDALYLVCRGCGEVFRQGPEQDFLLMIQEHGVSDPQSKSWCGDKGFDIVPESEAL